MMLLESSNSQNGYFLTFSQVHGLILPLKSIKRSSSNIFSYYIAEKKEKVMEPMLKIFANYNKLVLIAVLYKVFVFVNIVPSWKKKIETRRMHNKISSFWDIRKHCSEFRDFVDF